MTLVPPVAWALARQVLSHETGGRSEPVMLAEAIERIEMQLRGRLGELFGLTGYAALIARALHLAQTENAVLAHVTVNIGEGGLSGIHDFVEVARESGDDPHAAEAGLTAIVAHVIALLIIFIGEDLALRLVREGWPEFSYGQAALEGYA